MTLLAAAIEAVNAGRSVIPLAPRSKRPVSAWKRAQSERMTREQAARLWGQRPELNVGLVTGRISGFSVLDLDPRNDPTGETTRWLVPLMPPPTVITPHGWHWYVPETWPTFVKVRPGFDLKGEGGYVLAPPSIHPSGRPYERLCNGMVSLPDAVRAVIEQAVKDRRRTSQCRQQQTTQKPDDDADRLTMRDVLGLLECVRSTRDGWLARCPAHDDGRPSLTVGYGRDGRVLAYCWAGCAFADVLRALRERQTVRLGEWVRSLDIVRDGFGLVVAGDSINGLADGPHV